eukprot:IDg18894t1
MYTTGSCRLTKSRGAEGFKETAGHLRISTPFVHELEVQPATNSNDIAAESRKQVPAGVQVSIFTA